MAVMAEGQVGQGLYNVAVLSFNNRVISCEIENISGYVYNDNDCMIFVYANNKRIGYGTGLSIHEKYNSLLITKLRCEASCENNLYKDLNIAPAFMEINKMEFILMVTGGVVGFIVLIVIALCCICRRRRRYKNIPEHGVPMDLEKVPPMPTAPTPEPDSVPPPYKKEMEAELAAEVRKKKLSGSSEEPSEEDNVDSGGNFYNYNPRYNYAEITSEI